MEDLSPALVLLEASGGLELPLVAALAAAAALPVVVVNPRQSDAGRGRRSGVEEDAARPRVNLREPTQESYCYWGGE